MRTRERAAAASREVVERARQLAGSLLEELMVVFGLVLVVVALWPLVGRLALLVPGAALIWVGLPMRARFVEPRLPPAPKPGRKDAM